MDQEPVSRVDEQANFGKPVGREVADVVGDDHVCARRERRRHDVPIPGVDLVRDGGREAAGLVRHRLGEGRLHALAPAAELLLIVRLAPRQAPDQLVEDLGAPGWTEEAALREAEQQVADDPWVQNAGVEQGDEGHVALLVVDAEILGLRGHPGEHLPPLLAPASPVGEQIVEPDPPVRPDAVVRDLARL